MGFELTMNYREISTITFLPKTNIVFIIICLLNLIRNSSSHTGFIENKDLLFLIGSFAKSIAGRKRQCFLFLQLIMTFLVWKGEFNIFSNRLQTVNHQCQSSRKNDAEEEEEKDFNARDEQKLILCFFNVKKFRNKPIWTSCQKPSVK